MAKADTGSEHGDYCFCTDCCERRHSGGEEAQDYDAWRRAFPELPWDDDPARRVLQSKVETAHVVAEATALDAIARGQVGALFQIPGLSADTRDRMLHRDFQRRMRERGK